MHAGLAATGGRCWWTNLLDKPAGQLRCPQVLPTGIAHSRPACAHMPHRLPASHQFEKFFFSSLEAAARGEPPRSRRGDAQRSPWGVEFGGEAATGGMQSPANWGTVAPLRGAVNGAYCVQREKGRPESRASASPPLHLCLPSPALVVALPCTFCQKSA